MELVDLEMDDERAEGMRLALAHTRGLHDKVTLALGALRTQAGAHPAQRAEHDASALEAIR